MVHRVPEGVLERPTSLRHPYATSPPHASVRASPGLRSTSACGGERRAANHIENLVAVMSGRHVSHDALTRR
jgi:hypothetical protein